MRFLFEASHCSKTGYNGASIYVFNFYTQKQFEFQKDSLKIQQPISSRCTQENSEKRSERENKNKSLQRLYLGEKILNINNCSAMFIL